MRRLLTLLLLLLAAPVAAQTTHYEIERVADGVYAALAKPGSRASSNGFIVETRDWVMAGGAHMTREGIAELLATAALVTGRPVRYFVLPHHHRGFTYTDFDFPPGVEVLMSGETWQALQSEVRAVVYPALFFSEGLTLKATDRTVILTNLRRGHAGGDVAVFVPEGGVLFASDLVYVQHVGYLGDGHMEDWVLALEFLDAMRPAKVIPGSGPVSSGKAIGEFKLFMKDFLSEVLRHIERGDSLEKTRRTFSLPRYRHFAGYDQFIPVNVERAYRDLKETLKK